MTAKCMCCVFRTKTVWKLHWCRGWALLETPQIYYTLILNEFVVLVHSETFTVARFFVTPLPRSVMWPLYGFATQFKDLGARQGCTNESYILSPLFKLWDKISLSCSGWHRIHSVSQPVLELSVFLPQLFEYLELVAHASRTSKLLFYVHSLFLPWYINQSSFKLKVLLPQPPSR